MRAKKNPTPLPTPNLGFLSFFFNPVTFAHLVPQTTGRLLQSNTSYQQEAIEKTPPIPPPHNYGRAGSTNSGFT